MSNGTEPAVAGKPNPWGWMFGVIIDPANTFKKIVSHTADPHPTDPTKVKDTTKWWLPVIVVAVLAVVVSIWLVPNVIIPMQREIISEMVFEQGGTQADVDRAMSMAAGFAMPSAIVAALVQSFLMLFIVAGVMHLLAKMVGGKGGFRNGRAVVAYSMIVSAVGTIVKFPIMVSKKTMMPEVGPTLFFQNLEPSDRLFRILYTGFDVFTLWWLVVLIFGLAAGYRISRGKAVVPVIILWILMTVVMSFTPGGPFGAQG